MAVPKFDDLFNPLLRAMHKLGGSGSIAEIDDEVGIVLGLRDKDLNEIYKGNTTKLSYRLAWARNYLKRYGLLENSSKGVWALTGSGFKTKEADKIEVKRHVRSLSKKALKKEVVDEDEDDSEITWQDDLLSEIIKLSPASFERLCQRVLRESGFIQVEVTGRSGDGGIDGKGIMRLGGLLSFHVIFQCKRYTGNVGAKAIRDFRGAMVGRADKGLFLTTGNFTRDARSEATRDGAPPIDLVDGRLFVEKMKENGLGVTVKTEEVIEINADWFKEFK